MSMEDWGPNPIKRMQMENEEALRRYCKSRGMTVKQYKDRQSLKFWGTLLIIAIILPILVSVQSCVSA